MNMLEQLARLVLPKEILDNFDIVKIETDESDIDSMSLTIHLDERYEMIQRWPMPGRRFGVTLRVESL